MHRRTRLPGRVTGALRPQPLGKGRRTGGPQEAALGSEPIAPGQPRASTEGSRGKGCSGGAGPVGEGDPARTLTHRLVRLPARAPLLAPLRWCQQLASPPEAHGPVRVQEGGERSGASRGSVASRSERVGKVGRSLRPPGTPQTRPPPAPLSHGSCGPSHHTGSRLRAPRRGATAVPTNQKPSTAGARPTQGAFA